MKITKSQFLATLCALALSSGSALSAIVIYSDDFTSGSDGALNGQALVTPTTTTWTANAWNKNTTSGIATSGNGSAVVGAPTFSAGDVYTLTARVFNNLASSSTSWVAIGYTSGTTATFNGAGVGRYWMVWRGNDEVRAFGSGASALGPSGVSPAGESNTLDLRMVFDVDANTMTWLYKNPSATDWNQLHSVAASSSIIDNIQNVGMSSTTTNVGLISFELTNIPEPRAALLGGLGLLALLRRRR